jgi:hypothetical protein
MSRLSLLSVFVLLLLVHASQAADPVFSGPQVGEKLPPFKAKGVFGDLAGKEFDLIKRAEKKSVVLIFVHARTRPAFGLTNTIMKYAATRSKSGAGLESGVIFLTEDPTATEDWMRRVEKHFPKGVTFGRSLEGAEGPGAYGLNRNVTLTVLVGKDGKVTANLALVQPGIQADGPKILKAIVDVTGGGKVPTIAELAGPRYRGQARKDAPARKNDPKLTSLLRAVINKQASEDDVSKAAVEVENYVEKNETAKRELGRIVSTVANSGKFSNYGTEAARKKLKEWEKKYGVKTTERKKSNVKKASEKKPADKQATEKKGE